MDNPPLSPLVRVFVVLVLLVLCGGIMLLFAPETILDRWPWPVGPFSARFLGAIYSAEFAALAVFLAINRWAPGRLVLTMAAIFTVTVTAISLMHLGQFNFGRRGPWAWLFLYGGSAALSVAFLWHYRRLKHPGRRLDPAWRAFFLCPAAVLTGYGLLMLIAPRTATALWPWPALGLTGRVYGGLFLSAGAGAFLLSRSAAFEDLLVFGLTQLVFGATALASFYLAEASAPASDWEIPPDPSAWIVGCSALMLFGLGALAATLRTRPRSPQILTQS